MIYVITEKDYSCCEVIGVIQGQGNPDELFDDYIKKRLGSKKKLINDKIKFFREKPIEPRKPMCPNGDEDIRNWPKIVEAYNQWIIDQKKWEEDKIKYLEGIQKEFGACSTNDPHLKFEILCKEFGFKKLEFKEI